MNGKVCHMAFKITCALKLQTHITTEKLFESSVGQARLPLNGGNDRHGIALPVDQAGEAAKLQTLLRDSPITVAGIKIAQIRGGQDGRTRDASPARGHHEWNRGGEIGMYVLHHFRQYSSTN